MSCAIAEPDFCTTIVSNPNISGIGIRIAIYAQTFISMTVASLLPYNERAFRDTSRNTYLVSTGLIISAIVQWKTQGLSLFDALIITMLTTTMTMFVSVNSSYVHVLGLSINILSFLSTTFWCYWGLQVWQNPATFGLPAGQEGCNASADTVFVVFGHSISAMNSGLRGFAIFIFAAGCITAISSLWQCIIWSLKYAAVGARAAKDDAAMRFVKELRRRNGNSMGNVTHISRFGGMAGMIYMIITAEQIVARNRDVSSQVYSWNYGQTLAFILVGKQLMDCVSYFQEEIAHRQEQQEISSDDQA